MLYAIIVTIINIKITALHIIRFQKMLTQACLWIVEVLMKEEIESGLEDIINSLKIHQNHTSLIKSI